MKPAICAVSDVTLPSRSLDAHALKSQLPTQMFQTDGLTACQKSRKALAKEP